MLHSIFTFLFTVIILIKVSVKAESNKPSVIGGYDAAKGEFPYQVAIQRRHYFGGGSYHWCGGSILDKHHVLTAAHCLRGIPMKELVVFAGMFKLSAKIVAPAENVSVVQMFIHEGYVPDFYFNDVAVLRVYPEFNLNNDTIQPINLNEVTVEPGTNCTVSGWGLISTVAGSYPDILQAVTMPVIPELTCLNVYPDTFMPGMMCAGYLEGGRDSCKGDSGGPLECRGVLAGVVSHGTGCASPGFPGVYMNVTFYGKWIQSQVCRTEMQECLGFSPYSNE